VAALVVVDVVAAALPVELLLELLPQPAAASATSATAIRANHRIARR
jgi:hypothetical protein